MQANVEIIENPKESVDRAYDISISAREELLIAFPTVNSFLRNARTGMSMLLLREEYSKNNVRFRVLTPTDNQIIQITVELKRVLSTLDIRALNESRESDRATILLADRKECLLVCIQKTTSMKQ